MKHLIAVLLLLFSATVLAQDSQQPKTQVRVNYLNVCSPTDQDKADLSSALDRLPAKPRFAVDYEIARGRSTAPEESPGAGPRAKMMERMQEASSWVRIRKEFPDNSPFSNVQYSFSVADGRATETLIFRLRDPKELLQVSISDSVVAPENPAQVVTTRTPADRIRIERFGKSSAVLARCKDSDQSALEPMFQKASSFLDSYRELLNANRIVPQELPKPEPAKTMPMQ